MAQRTATGFTAARVAYAVGLALAPGKAAAAWIGPDAELGPTQVGLRGLAARDLLTSLGAYVALRRGRAARPWLLACALGDCADLAATLRAGDQLPPRARAGGVTVAGAAALLGLGLAAALER